MRKKILSLLLPILLLVAGVAWAAPGTGITGTPHDFTQGEFQATPAVGLCTFCHTPHKAGTQRLIWNHQLSANSYNWGTVTHTIGGTELPAIDTSWTGPTRFCLSCHDGSVAFGSVYWFDKKTYVGVSPINVGVEDNMTYHTNHLIGLNGNLAGNHPVAVPYPLSNVKNTYNGVSTGDGVLMGDFVANPQVNNIRLFYDNGGVVVAGASPGKTGIECSSCHDPHNGSTVTGKWLLRGDLTGSGTTYICLKCHTK